MNVPPTPAGSTFAVRWKPLAMAIGFAAFGMFVARLQQSPEITAQATEASKECANYYVYLLLVVVVVVVSIQVTPQ
jgi:ABC-type uncharacterized transport system permease subunit